VRFRAPLQRAQRVVGAWQVLPGRAPSHNHRRPCDHLPTCAPEYGATYLDAIDQQTIDYLKLTGREPEQVALVEHYAQTTGLWADAGTARLRTGAEQICQRGARSMAGELPTSPPAADLCLA
jgi:aconitate hydratase